MPFASVWLDTKERHVLDEGGFQEFPYCVPRWSKASGEKYGRSPALDALADIKTLHKMRRDVLVLGEKVANPPINSPDENLDPNMLPGGINFYDTRGGKVEPIALGQFFPVTLEMLQQAQNEIRDAFYESSLKPVDTKQMTAEEVRARITENIRVLGPTFGRLSDEFLSPLLTRVVGILTRAGMMPALPDELAGEPGTRKMSLRYTSPIARGQRAEEAQAVTSVVMFAANMAQVAPQVMDAVDVDEAVRSLALLDGAPTGLVRNEKEVAMIRDARARQEQAVAQTQLEMSRAQTLESVAGVAEKGARASKTVQEARNGQ
jgi:hypothetical protein